MWVQTGAYHLGGLYWLIALIVVFIIALIALIVAGRALTRARPHTGGPRGPESRGNRECPEPGLKTGRCRNPSGCWTSATPRER